MLRHMNRAMLLCTFACFTLSFLTPTVRAKELALDRNVSPSFQVIELDLDADRTEYSGRVTIELTVKNATDAFTFHAHEMSLDEVSLRGARGKIGIEVDMNDEGYVGATCADRLKPGRYTLEIGFSKDYNTQAVGLYRMETDGDGYLFTQFEAIDARRAFPCWDEPSFKIPYQITVTIPESQVVVSNTPIESDTKLEGAKRRVVFERTKPMPSYLLALAAGPLESVEITGLSVPGRVYTVKGQKQLAGLAVGQTPGILAACERWFGTPYPYKKLDLIAVPEYWPGAMENPGAITYSDRLLLSDPNATSVRTRQYLALVTAHEISHMWFGDLVTMTWWDDLWLNESFADWMGEKIAHSLYPEYKIDLDQLGDVQQLLAGDARPSTSPVRKPVDSVGDFFTDLGLAYGKGKSVLRMVEQWIGPDVFQSGVRNYLKENAWGNTVAADLFEALSEAGGKDVTPVLSSFLDQPGYPMITVATEPKGKIRLSQKRFLNYGVDAEPLEWNVPVRIKHFNGKKIAVKTVLLERESMTVDLGRDVIWALPDAGAVGYYRWSVPSEMFARIVEDPESTLDEREQSVFLANAKALLDAGEMGGDDYLRVLGGFAGVHTPEMIDAVITGLVSIEGALITDDLRDAFATYVRRTLRPALDTFGMQKRDGEPESISLLRPRLLWRVGGVGRDDEVRSHCKRVAEQFMNDPTSVDPSVAGVTVRVAVKDGGQAEFDACKQLFESASVPAVRSVYLNALGSFEDGQLQNEALAYIVTGKVRGNELFTIPRRVSITAEGRDRIWQWMTENYELMTSRMPPEFAVFMPFMASGCERERLEAAREFFADPGHSVDGTQENLNKVADSTNDCVSLRERESGAVRDYLNQLLAGQ